MSAQIIQYHQLEAWRANFGGIVSVTNGCFDIFHAGHVELLRNAKNNGFLVVGLNGDASVRELKGEGRPINAEKDRAKVMASIRYVDAVCIFPEKEATEFLRRVRPNIYTKGGDYTMDTLNKQEREVLDACSALIRFVPTVAGMSTTKTLQKLDGEQGGPFHVKVNGVDVQFELPIVNQELLVKAKGDVYDPEQVYSITWFRGRAEKPEGILHKNDTVRLRNGMSFSVFVTGNS